jgi:RimJ/RimL family protein N-acetyltransferase
MNFRPAKYSDWEMLFKWRNDPETLANSINSSPILDHNHKEWLKLTLELDTRKIYIYGDGVGTIRTDEVNKGASMILSWTVAPEFRGQGLGARMLKDFTEQFAGKYYAEILPHNKASLRVAEKAGFKVVEQAPKSYVKAPNTILMYLETSLTDGSIIDAIQQVRNKNNVNWMDILRIAFKYAPEETRDVFKRITDSDDEIGKLSRQLANNEKKS